MESVRVLLVDAGPAVNEELIAALDEASFPAVVETVPDFDAALSSLTADNGGDVDCVVGEYSVPDTDGAAFHDALRETGLDVPVVFFTAAETSALPSRVVADSATAYVSNAPGGHHALLCDRIRNLVERQRAERTAERGLAALEDAVPALIAAETRDEIAAIAVDAIEAVLDVSIVGVFLYDESAGVLRPAAHSATAGVVIDEQPTFDGSGSLAWEVFAEGGSTLYDDVTDHPAVHNPETPIRTEFCLSLGDHGVMLVSATDTAAIDDTDAEFARVLAADVESALDRADRERALRDRETELEARNASLDRLDRLNTVIREIQGALIEPATREEIERAVTDRLVDTGLALAFVADATGGTDAPSIRTRASADGFGDAGIDDLLAADPGAVDPTDADVADPDVADADPDGSAVSDDSVHPVRRVLDSGTPARAERLVDHETTWAQRALSVGFQSVCAVPLRYGDLTYGVLCTYAAEPGVFDARGQAVFAELGAAIGHAMSAADRTQALVTDSTTEIEFEVRDTGLLFVSLASRLDCRVALDRVTDRAGDAVTVAYAVDASPDAISRALDDAASFSESQVTTRDDSTGGDTPTTRVELTHTAWFGEVFAARGAVIKHASATGGVGTLVVSAPRGLDVRTLVEAFTDRYPDADLRARRERPARTELDARSVLDDSLTDRQGEVLRVAYEAGYLDWPRERSAADVAASLDIAQPTFSEHFWTGLRSLLTALFDDGDDGDPAAESGAPMGDPVRPDD